MLIIGITIKVMKQHTLLHFSNAMFAALAISKYALTIPSLTVNLAYKTKGLLPSVIKFPPNSSLKILLYNNLCSLKKATLPTRWHST